MGELPPEAVPIVGLALVVVAVLVVVGVVSARREAHRRDRIRRWAASSGWTVARRQRVGWSVRLPGSSKKVALLVTGTVGGYPVQVAEYSVTKHSTTSAAASAGVSASASVWPTRSTTRTMHYLVTAVRLAATYPPIAVTQRGALSQLGQAMFGSTAPTTGHVEFDKRYRVKTKDPALARRLIGPALIAEHLADRVPPWSLAGNDLLTWKVGRIRDPSEIEAVAAHLIRVAQLMGR